ncbi:hypothetical protein [Frigidibacter sp. MR17.24]|uniref:hypothetical protein n=1 Tax=Frigidibacter sp. MR17.24 TaxID=3127345 RepID=UPI0030129DA1
MQVLKSAWADIALRGTAPQSPLLVGLAPALAQAIEADLGRACCAIGFRSLSREMLAALQPRLVIAELVGRDHDGIEIADRLHALGFVGQLRLIAPSVPRPCLIRREIAAATEGRIDVDILPLPRAAGPAARLN